jgi:hypothetical protein
MMYLSGGATIKEKISTPLVSRPLSTMLPEHVLMSHRAHCFIIDVQPNFPCIAVSVLMKNIDRIVPATRRLAVMVEHPTERIMRRFRGLLGSGYHDV